MTEVTFNWSDVSSREVFPSDRIETPYVNLKNRAEGPRRIGFANSVVAFVLTDGRTIYRAEFQTTLNGVRYQSAKDGAWRNTREEAIADLAKTVAGALKRYAKLALDPANKIEAR